MKDRAEGGFACSKISLLLNAIEAWREADSDFALNGEYGDVAEVWDAAKARMVALADEVRAAMPDLSAPKPNLLKVG